MNRGEPDIRPSDGDGSSTGLASSTGLVGWVATSSRGQCKEWEIDLKVMRVCCRGGDKPAGAVNSVILSEIPEVESN